MLLFWFREASQNLNLFRQLFFSWLPKKKCWKIAKIIRCFFQHCSFGQPIGRHEKKRSIVWNFFDLMWPHQPPSKRVPFLVKNWIFSVPFHKKWPVLVILVPVMIGSSGSESFLRKLAFRGCWGHWGCRGCWNQWGWRGFYGPEKSLLRTSEVFQVLESNILRTLFWCFEKKIFWQNLKNSYWILSSLLSEAVEAVWGQNKFIWLIRHKFPLLRKSLSISFWYICQNIWSSQVFTLCQNLMVDPVD